MKLSPSFTDTWVPRVLSILRIVSAYMFMLHGTQKLLGFPAGRSGTVDLMSLAGVAGMLELVGGLLLLIGLFTRPVAFLLSGEMAFAYFISHAPRGNPLLPITNGGDLAVEWCFVFLFLAVVGGGQWALDAVLSRRREPVDRALTRATTQSLYFVAAIRSVAHVNLAFIAPRRRARDDKRAGGKLSQEALKEIGRESIAP